MNQCLTCKNEIKFNPKSHSSSTRKYCSRKCYWKDIPNKECPNKGRKAPWVINSPQIFKKGHKAPKTAFKKGFIPWNKGIEWKEIKGENHPNWKGGISQKIRKYNRTESKKLAKLAFKRDNWTCRVCGIKKRLLHAHHIKVWKDFPESRFNLDNLLTVCVECHKKIHKNNGIDSIYNKIIQRGSF